MESKIHFCIGEELMIIIKMCLISIIAIVLVLVKNLIKIKRFILLKIVQNDDII